MEGAPVALDREAAAFGIDPAPRPESVGELDANDVVAPSFALLPFFEDQAVAEPRQLLQGVEIEESPVLERRPRFGGRGDGRRRLTHRPGSALVDPLGKDPAAVVEYVDADSARAIGR